MKNTYFYFYFILCLKAGELEATDGMTPLDVVVRILNNQLSSLMWIDEKVSFLFLEPSTELAFVKLSEYEVWIVNLEKKCLFKPECHS